MLRRHRRCQGGRTGGGAERRRGVGGAAAVTHGGWRQPAQGEDPQLIETTSKHQKRARQPSTRELMGLRPVSCPCISEHWRSRQVPPTLFCSGAGVQVLQEAETPPLLRSPVEVIAFCDEEGLRYSLTCAKCQAQRCKTLHRSLGAVLPHLVLRGFPVALRFGTTFLGSRAVAGALLSNGLLAAQDKGGKSLADVLSMHGFDASPAAIAKIAVPRERIRGCVSRQWKQLNIDCAFNTARVLP